MMMQSSFTEYFNPMLKVNKHSQLENKCRELFRDDRIRFVGIINNMGKLIAGGFNKGIIPTETEEQRRMLYIQMALEIAMRKDFDETLDKINYIATNRDNVLMVSIPMNNYLVLISAEPTATPEEIIKKCHANEFFQSEA
jgi:hypothetical protein